VLSASVGMLRAATYARLILALGQEDAELAAIGVAAVLEANRRESGSTGS